MKRLALIFAAFLAATTAGVAQAPKGTNWPPPAGTRARISSPALGVGRHVGTIESVVGDTLQFRTAEGFSVPLKPAEITMMEVSAGTHTSKLKWAAIGLLTGAGLGAVVGSATYTPCRDSFKCIGDIGGRKGSVALGAVAGALVGVAAGTLVGARHREAWIPVSR
jgi:hypothetical protein